MFKPKNIGFTPFSDRNFENPLFSKKIWFFDSRPYYFEADAIITNFHAPADVGFF